MPRSPDFYSFENFRGDTADLGKEANYFFVGLTAVGTRTENNMLPHLDISIDTLQVELLGTDSVATFPLYNVYILRGVKRNEVLKEFMFADSSGSSDVIFIPGSVDTLRVSFNAKLTDRTREQNVTYQPVQMTLVRKESRSLAPWW